MNRAKQAHYGRIGGLKGGVKTGPTKRRDVDYSALGRLGAAKRKQKQEQK